LQIVMKPGEAGLVALSMDCRAKHPRLRTATCVEPEGKTNRTAHIREFQGRQISPASHAPPCI
jgi:hypothetical protein